MNGQMVNSMMANREPILMTDRHSAIQELTRLIQQIVPDSGQQNPQTLAQQVEQSVYNSVFKISGSRREYVEGIAKKYVLLNKQIQAKNASKQQATAQPQPVQPRQPSVPQPQPPSIAPQPQLPIAMGVQGRYPIPSSQKPGTNPFPSGMVQRGYPSQASFVPAPMESGIQLQPNPTSKPPTIVPQPNPFNSSSSNQSLERQQYEQKLKELKSKYETLLITYIKKLSQISVSGRTYSQEELQQIEKKKKTLQLLYSILSGGTHEKNQTLQYLQQVEIYFQKFLPIPTTPKNSPLSPNNYQTSSHTITPPMPLPPKIPGEKKVPPIVKLESSPVKPATIKPTNRKPTISDLVDKICVPETHNPNVLPMIKKVLGTFFNGTVLFDTSYKEKSQNNNTNWWIPSSKDELPESKITGKRQRNSELHIISDEVIECSEFKQKKYRKLSNSSLMYQRSAILEAFHKEDNGESDIKLELNGINSEIIISFKESSLSSLEESNNIDENHKSQECKIKLNDKDLSITNMPISSQISFCKAYESLNIKLTKEIESLPEFKISFLPPMNDFELLLSCEFVSKNIPGVNIRVPVEYPIENIEYYFDKRYETLPFLKEIHFTLQQNLLKSFDNLTIHSFLTKFYKAVETCESS